MSRSPTSRDAAHFERLYRNDPDPWHFTTSAYEQEKYSASLRALGDRHCAAGLEVGCSIGVLTERLAARCDTLLGIDIVPEALAAARARCASLQQVRFELMQVPDRFPEGRFDLIVLSEMLYFLTPADIARLAARVEGAIAAPGVVLLVNYTGTTDDPCTGDQAAVNFITASAGLRRTLHRRAPTYRIDVLESH